MNTDKKVWFITGVSSGLGKQLAKEVLSQGEIVVGTFRKQEQVEEFNNQNPGSSFGVLIDVASNQMIVDGVKSIFDKFGKIDVVVNNAGYGIMGSIEEISDKEVRRQFEVNVFGYACFMQEVLPHMRAQKSGCIINISSILGKISIPGFGWYAASKHAIEALSETLRGEVMRFGINVVVIAPGLIKTEFAAKEFELLKTVKHAPAYQKLLAALPRLLAGEPKAPGPEVIAKAVLNAATVSSPAMRHALPADSKTAVIARWFLGGRIWADAVYAEYLFRAGSRF